MKSGQTRVTLGTTVTLSPDVIDALRRGQEALQGESNDEDHDALYALVNAFEDDLAGGLPNEPCVRCPSVSAQDKPTRGESATGLKLVIPTYNGKWVLESPEVQDFDEPHVPVLITQPDGVRIVLGTHDHADFNKPEIQIERRHNGWMIFLSPLGGGDPSGFVVFLDDGRSYVAPERGLHGNEIIMVGYEQAVAELDDPKPNGPSCVPSVIANRNAGENE